MLKSFFRLCFFTVIVCNACKQNAYHVIPLAPAEIIQDTLAVHFINTQPGLFTLSTPYLYLNGKQYLPTYDPFNHLPLPLPTTFAVKDTFQPSLDSLRFLTAGKIAGKDTTRVPYFTLPRNGKHHYVYFYAKDSLWRSGSAGNAEVFNLLEQQVPPSAGMFRLRLGNFYLRSRDNIGIYPPATTPSYSMLFADGTPVPGLQNIAYGHFSPTLELPYGVYAFRIRNNVTGYELPYFPINVHNYPFVAAPVNQASQHQHFYEEGATYNFNCLTVQGGGYGGTTHYNLEYVDVNRENESSTPIPRNVAQVTYFNAAADGGSFTGQNATGALSLGQAAGPYAISPGPLSVSFQGKDSTIRASFKPDRLDNWTIVSHGRQGQPGLMVLPTYLPNDTIATGAAGGHGNNANIYIRFLNISPDAGNVAFVGIRSLNGLVEEAVIDPVVSGNVPYGKFLTRYPFTDDGRINQYSIINLSSSPLAVPIHIAVRQATDNPQQPGPLLNTIELDYPFVHNPAQFFSGNIYVGPVGQPGVYTIALVGSVSPTAPPEARARIVVIPHTR